MVKRISLSSLDTLLACIGQHKDSGNVYVLFCGDKVKETDKSWCSDCVKAEPVVDKVLKDVTQGVFITCTVGDRIMWKDPENVFRKHPQIRLSGVPTLLQWGTPKRLGDEDCSKEDLVKMLFEVDD